MSAKTIRLSHPTGILKGTVQLPASKSESNRALLIQALSKEKITLHNLSDANDTVLLQKLLASAEKEIDAEDAGTVMRFLTAYFSLTNQHKILTGTARMCQRPIGILVEALRELGVEINYLQQEGFPPLEIKGFNPGFLGKPTLKIRGDVSSQYISALLLCAPVLPHGLKLELEGKIASRPYIEMTLALMQQFGVSSYFEENAVEIPPQKYSGGAFSVEADWSAASYWYSIVALAKEVEILLSGLKENSLQGDKKVAELMVGFGVKTTFLPEGIVLSKRAGTTNKVAIDFSDIPDLAQTFAVLAAAKSIELEMTSLESLRIKETDRIAALQTELFRIGATLTEIKPGTFLVKSDSNFPKSKVWGFETPRKENSTEQLNFKEKIDTDISFETTFKTYHDHRMAMAFAPLALLQNIEIDDLVVVRKSYPNFWDELRKVGFEIA